MAMRVTGMMSGLDTESIIQELVAVRQTKVDTLKKEQTKLEWKQDAWKELNNKIKKLYSGTLSDLRYQSSYMKKATKTSNDNLVSVIAKDSAMDSVQSLEINKLAKAGYLTGAEITDKDGNKVTSGSKLVEKLGIEAGSKFEITSGGKTVEITVDENTTINSLVSKLQSVGVKANFDATNQRLFIGASGTGEEKDFTITASNDSGTKALDKLGILVYDKDVKAAYQKYADLANDSDAKQSAIEAKTAELLKSYKAEKTSLESAVESLKKKQDELVKAYNEEYGSEDFDIKNSDSRAERQETLNEKIAELEEQLKDENLTEEEKATLTADLNKAKGELSYLDGYDTNLKSITEKTDRITELNTDYINENGTAGAKTVEEATADIEGKIAKAQDVLANYDDLTGSKAFKVDGEDAEITLNGAPFTSSSNTFDINGLTITCKGETAVGEKITLTTENDVSGIYDMVKNFIKEYSSLINEMDKLYNAESSKGYDPLTDEEKDSMSEKEVEKWEEKIKDSLLRRDSTLNSVSSAMKEIMAGGYTVNGKTLYLSDFGIETLGYFNAADNEKNAYHINGDEDEETLKTKDNTLKEMITKDPNTVVDFFTQLSKTLYTKLDDLMARSDYSSMNTVYDDKKMKEDYDSYSSKIKEAEAKLTDYEDKWYKKFSAMETALAKMQSNSSAVTSLLGGS
ncbi:MAG: flagellar filament capping protein FliD [Lachnospiraceae bacterium]|nr:flagellar filament capping protein FliD [Lachnospiraceae bacterium]